MQEQISAFILPNVVCGLGLNQAFSKILSKKSNRKTNKKNEFH